MDQFLKYVEYFAFTLAGGIVGYFIRLFIEHRLAIDRIKENIRITEFNKAAAAFRATFVDEVFYLRRNVEPFRTRYNERREDIEIVNEKAKIIFEAFLPQKELAGFNAVWEQYINPEEKNNIKVSPSGEEYYREVDQLRLFHINHLLEYAKPKL